MKAPVLAISVSIIAAMLFVVTTFGVAAAQQEESNQSKSPSNLMATKSGNAVRLTWDVVPKKNYSRRLDRRLL